MGGGGGSTGERGFTIIALVVVNARLATIREALEEESLLYFEARGEEWISGPSFHPYHPSPTSDNAARRPVPGASRYQVSGTFPRLLASVTMQAEWEICRGDYDPAFVSYVERALAEKR